MNSTYPSILFAIFLCTNLLHICYLLNIKFITHLLFKIILSIARSSRLLSQYIKSGIFLKRIFLESYLEAENVSWSSNSRLSARVTNYVENGRYLIELEDPAQALIKESKRPQMTLYRRASCPSQVAD